MWITNADRDVKVLYYEPTEQELKTLPNIRDGKIKEIVLYLDYIMLADYDSPVDALREMEEIQRAYLAGHEEYQVKDYELNDTDKELVRYLTEKYKDAFMPSDDEILERWANLT